MFRPPAENAFAFNCIGGRDPAATRGFPAWVKRSTIDDITTLSFGVVRLQDFVDLAVNHPAVFVFDVGHYWFDESSKQVTLEAIGNGYDIAARGGDGDNVLYSSEAFLALTTELSHYQLSALGLLTDTVQDISDLWVRAKEVNWSDGIPIISNIDEADLFIDIHDDCYAYLETRDEAIADAVAARLLWLAMTALTSGFEMDPPEAAPDPYLVEHCLGNEGVFFANMDGATVADGVVALPFNHVDEKVFDLPTPPTTYLNYSVEQGWLVTEA